MTRRAESSSQPAWTASDLKGNPHEAPDKAERVRAMFASIADRYDLNNRLHSLWRDQAWRRKAVAMCAVRATDRVLDVACGTGDLSEAFARAGAGSVCGVDFTESMLEIARRKAMRGRPPEEASPTYRKADAMALPFEDGAFDIVAIAFGLRNVADPRRALAEMKRVLRADGRLMILEFSEPRHAALRALDRVYRQRIMPVTAAWLARDRSGAYRYLPRSVSTFAEGAALVEMMRKSGFSSISQHPMTFGICTAYLGRAGPAR